MLQLPRPDILALITGETVVAFVERGQLTEGDERHLAAMGTRHAIDIKPAYHRWLNSSIPEEAWIVVVTDVHPTALLDPTKQLSYHVLSSPGTGDLAILRVYKDGHPVLSDEAFAARRRSIQGALTT